MRRQAPRVVGAASVAVALALAAACAALFATDIGKIKQDPRAFDGKQVTVSGEVQTTINVLGLGYYEIADNTGSIGVVTRGAVPRKGERVRVKGKVDQAFAIAGKSLVVIVEGNGQK